MRVASKFWFAIRCIALLMAFSCAASAGEQEHIWQIGWQTHEVKGYLVPFSSTTTEARVRLDAANLGDPEVMHWLEMSAAAPRPVSFPVDFGETGQPETIYVHGLYDASVAFFAEANLLDVMSSYHRRELNPILAGSGGRFDASSVARKGLLIGAILGTQMYLVHKHPRTMRRAAIANYIATAALAAIVAHNYLLPAMKTPR
jgi:acyl dehydratase